MRFFRGYSSLDPKSICKRLDDLDAIALSPTAVHSKEELDLALCLAKNAFAKKTNIARKLKYEFILWLAGKRDIKSAMEATYPKEGEEFLVVVFSDSDEKAVLKSLKTKKKAIGLKKKAEPLELERISLSRVKN